MRGANLAVKFLLELGAFAALAYVGTRVGRGAGAVVLAVVFPLIAIVIWGRWAAPRAPRRLPPPSRVPLELTILGLAAIGLAACGQVLPGVILAAVIVANAVLLTAFHQWEG